MLEVTTNYSYRKMENMVHSVGINSTLPSNPVNINVVMMEASLVRVLAALSLQ